MNRLLTNASLLFCGEQNLRPGEFRIRLQLIGGPPELSSFFQSQRLSFSDHTGTQHVLLEWRSRGATTRADAIDRRSVEWQRWTHCGGRRRRRGGRRGRAGLWWSHHGRRRHDGQQRRSARQQWGRLSRGIRRRRRVQLHQQLAHEHGLAGGGLPDVGRLRELQRSVVH